MIFINQRYWMIFLFFLIFNSVNAADYFVDAKKGSDVSGNGSQEKPFQTIQKAADAMQSNDVCLIRGGTYRETVLPKDKQTFKPYNEEYVLITGCDIINSGKEHKNAIYKIKVSSEVRAVFLNGRHMQKARWPNEDGDPFTKDEWADTHAKNITINGGDTATVNFKTPLPKKNWIGAYYIGLNGFNHYNSNVGRIAKVSENTVVITKLNHQLKKGFGGTEGKGHGYLIHHLSALDAPTEWHWQNDSLYFYPPEGDKLSESKLEVQTRLWGFDLSKSNNVTVKGIHFKAASIVTGGDAMEGSEGNTIDGCTFRYHAPFGVHYYAQYYHDNGASHERYAAGGPIDGTSGITVAGSNHVIINCYIGHAWGMGIRLFGNNNTVQNCFIEDVNWITRLHFCGIRLAGRGHVVTQNTIQHVAGSGIHGVEIDIRGKHNTLKEASITNNIVRDYAYLLRDGETAGIYCSNHNAPTDDRKIDGEIAYNVVYGNRTHEHRVSCGIYCDDGSDFVKIHHNVIHGGGTQKYGIFLHGNRHNQENVFMYHNTVMDITTYAGCSATWDGGGARTNVIYRNNISTGPGYGNWGIDDPVITDHNLDHVELREFKDSVILDLRLANERSAAIDAAMTIPGINDEYNGEAPDIGAYEFGDEKWKAGSTIEVPEFKD